jgi:hypothetical protein
MSIRRILYACQELESSAPPAPLSLQHPLRCISIQAHYNIKQRRPCTTRVLVLFQLCGEKLYPVLFAAIVLFGDVTCDGLHHPTLDDPLMLVESLCFWVDPLPVLLPHARKHGRRHGRAQKQIPYIRSAEPGK